MYKIKRAIILAAGYGNRLAPFTDSTPKPLLPVHGVPIAERLIESLLAQGITDITMVTGYRRESFSYLQDKYGTIRLLYNPDYEKGNNILSLYAARNVLRSGSTMILDADQWIYDASILNPYFVSSCYLASYVEGDTKEWLLELEGDRIRACSRIGGRDGWRLYSVSLWSEEDAARLAAHIECDAHVHRELYWDDVALFLHRDEFRLSVRKMSADSLCEIDTTEELCAMDPTYAELLRDGGNKR